MLTLDCLLKYTRKPETLAVRRPEAVGGSVLWAENQSCLLGLVGVVWGIFNGYSVKTVTGVGVVVAHIYIRGIDGNGIAARYGITFVVEIIG